MIVLEGYTECGTLKYGSRGKCVELLQTYLSSVLSPVGIKLTVDGIYGSKTLEAVKFFQKSRGLTVDGIVGSQTWSSLEREVDKIYGSGTHRNIKSSILGEVPKPAPETVPTPKVAVSPSPFPVGQWTAPKTLISLLIAIGVTLIAWSLFGKKT